MQSLLYSLAIASSLAGLSSASPASSQLRKAPHRQSSVAHPLAQNDEIFDNWCGAIQHGSDITYVEASWPVTAVQTPNGGSPSTKYTIYNWIGIDGTGGCNVLLQAGTGADLLDGKTYPFAWYEFYPAGPVDAKMTINVGDEVFVSVEATSPTEGTIVIENKTTGESKTFNPVSTQGSLCFQSAEWIAEDPLPDPFPSFSSFAFGECKATTSTGKTFNLAGSSLATMVQNGVTYCHATQDNDDAVTVTYG